MEACEELSEAERALREISNRETETTESLESLLSKQTELDTRILNIHRLIPSFQLVHNDTDELNKIVTYTAGLAEDISQKVKQLDLAKSRVAQCLQRVDDIMDLKACTDGVKTALENEDYEQAASHVHRFLGLDQRGLRSCVDIQEGSSLEEAFAQLTEAQRTLIDIVTQRFNESLSQSDQASIERFFKIFPLLNQHNEGLTKYSNYLCRQITDTACQTLRKVQETSKTDKNYKIVLADAFSMLFEDVARVIDVHKAIVERYYGLGHIQQSIEILHKECCVQQRRLFQELLSVRSLPKRCKKIQELIRKGNSERPGLRGNSSSGSLVQDALSETKEIDAILEEIALIQKHAELYLRYIRRKVNSDYEAAKLPPEQKSERLAVFETRLAACDLIKDMQELTTYYICLEEFFMLESVKKAIDFESFEDSSKTSSLLEDVFFLLKKCLRRSFSTSSPTGACVIINHSCSLIENEFFRACNEKILRGFPTGAMLDHAFNIMQGKLQSQAEQERDRGVFVVTLNNLDTACEYIATLVEALQIECTKRFPNASKEDSDKLSTCLTSLQQSANKLRALASSGIGQLSNSALRPHIKVCCDSFNTTNHQLSENEFYVSMLEADDGLRPFMQQFVMNLDHLLSSFREVLNAKNNDQLVTLVASDITQLFEKTVLRTVYNRLGGMQFDKELRYLIGYLTKVANWSIRDKFSKLTQIALLLNVENVSEVEEICKTNQSYLTWRLTPAEVRQVLSLRTEFKVDDIKKLHL